MTGNTLSGRVIAVTGGAQGIGEATAQALAAQGAKVVIGDLDIDLAKKSAEAYGGLALPLDVTSRESFAGFLDAVVKEHGRLDGLVNNAGFMVLGRVLETPLERQLSQIDVNLSGLIVGCYEGASRMQAGGRIVNIASVAGRVPIPGSAVYNATKAGVLAFSESLDAELRPRDIRVSCVLPSFTNTHLIDGTTATGMTKPIEPSEVADAVVASMVKPKLFRVRPRAVAYSAAHWSSMHAALKPAKRKALGLESIFAEHDHAARASYDERTGGSAAKG